MTATAASSTAIALRWSDTNTSEPGYVVERSLTGISGFKRVAVLGPNVVTYTNSALTPATRYYYRIVTRGTSKRSEVASATTTSAGALPTPQPTVTPQPTATPRPTATPAPTADTTPPSVPSGLSGSASGCNQINLSWSASSDSGSGILGYRVFRNGAHNTFVNAPGATASDANVTGGTVYNYAVTAVDKAGNESAKSATLALNTPACPGSGGPWVRSFGGASPDYARAVAVDGAGNVFVVGSFKTTASFGGPALTSAGGADVFIAKYSASGAHLWSKRFGSAGDESAQAVAVDGNGAVFVGGNFSGASTDLGGGPLANSSPGISDGFVAKYSAAGQHLWSQSFGGPDTDSTNGLAVGPDGNVVATGVFKGTSVDFGGRILASTWGGLDSFLVKLSGATGDAVWAKNVKCGGPDVAHGVAVDDSGNVFMIGEFGGNADFGAGYVTTAGLNDVYLAKYSSSGGYLWAKQFGGTSQDSGAAVAVDGAGNVAITGNFLGSVSFGGAALTSASSSNDVFVARYTAAGAHIWSRRIGDYYVDYGLGIGSDAAGNVVVTGSFYGTVNFGGGSVTSASTQTADAFVAEYSPTGAHLWSSRYGSTDNERGQAVAYGPNGAVVTGFYTGTVNFGGQSLSSAGFSDGFLLSLGQ